MNVYMNGRGIKARTRELNDDLWDALGGALLGAVPGVVSIMIIPVAVLTGWWFLWLLTLGLGYLSYELHLPWLRARRAVREHREALEAETAKRGKGWASS